MCKYYRAPRPELVEHTRTDPPLGATVRAAYDGLREQQQCCHVRSPYTDLCTYHDSGKHTGSPRLTPRPKRRLPQIVRVRLPHDVVPAVRTQQPFDDNIRCRDKINPPSTHFVSGSASTRGTRYQVHSSGESFGKFEPSRIVYPANVH